MFASEQWYATAAETIDTLVREEFPRTRPNGPDRALFGMLMHHARENGADADRLRQILRDSPEYADNQKPAVDPEVPPPVQEPGPTGPVDRIQYPVVATAHGWMDATGYRPIILQSFFPALYFEKHDPGRVDYVLGLLQADGINGIRGFGFVGGAVGWGRHLGDGWRDREVLTVPMVRGNERLAAWPDAKDVVIRLARKLEARGMVWDLTQGDLQTVDGDEALVMQFIAQWLSEAGLTHVLCLAETNEGWQNSRRGNDPAHFERLVKPLARLGVPWGTSAHPPIDGPGYNHDQMEKMAVPGSVACYHVTSGTETQVRHTFNVRHDGEGIGFRRAVASTEHRGPGPDVSSGAVNETGWVALVGVMAVMTGQLFVLHTSQGVRDLPTDHGWEAYRPYAQRLTAMARHIPRSKVVGIGHGGRGGVGQYSIFASTRADGAFAGDKPGVSGEFHRADSAAYADGQVAALLYGGSGHRRIKCDAIEGTFYDTHGNVYLSGRWPNGDVLDLSDPGDGLLFVGRRV
jgi:hypothetical protein